MTAKDVSQVNLPDEPGSSLWSRYVRDGELFSWDRVRFACLCAAIGFALGFAYMLAADNQFTSPNGTLMMDYLSFWLAGSRVWLGDPAMVYDPQAFSALQAKLSGSGTVFGFFYPPTFQLLQAAFSVLPYKAAFVAFVLTTTGLLCWVCRLITGRWVWAVCLILVPACLNNGFHGQNAALTAALLGLALVGVERGRFVPAGVAIGLLTIKPQLGVLIPLALIAAGYWRVFLSASVTTVLLAGTSVLILGISTWQAFWSQAPVATAVMVEGGVEWAKMVSVYGSLRVAGLGHTVAMALQIAIGLSAAACVWTVWRRSNDMVGRSAVLVGGILLTTPFALSYDLTLLVIPCAFLLRAGLESGFRPYERFALACVIGLSASTSPIALATGLPFAPLLPAIILFLGLSRLARPSFVDNAASASQFAESSRG